MKKSKIKMLTASACLALVGTASAAWVYAGTATESANIGVKVAAYADAGTIEVSGADNLRVYLDKGSVTVVKEDSTIPFKATYTKPDGFDTKTVTLTYQVAISSYLSSYVVFDSSITSSEQSNKSIATGYDYSWTSGDEIALSSLPGLTWKSSHTKDDDVPGSGLEDKNSYITLIGAITGKGIGNDFDINQTWDGTAKKETHNISINFKAVVAD